MSIDTIRIEAPTQPTVRGKIDVSDLSLETACEVAETGLDAAYFERRGTTTYLLQ